MKKHLRAFSIGLALAVAGIAAAALFPYFGPSTGILVGTANSPQTRAATASDISGLWTGCSAGSPYMGYQGTCNPSTACTFAAPTAKVGLTAITGSTGDCMDAGSAPALDTTISPTMTGAWTLAAATTIFGADANPSTIATSVASGSGNAEFEVTTGGNAALCFYTLGGAGSACGQSNVGNTQGIASYPASIPIYLASKGGIQIEDPNGAFHAGGYLGSPTEVVSGSYTVTENDNGKTLFPSVANPTISIPCGSIGAGYVVTIDYVSGTDTLTISASSGILYWANGTVTSGNRTLTSVGIATVIVDPIGNCEITGSGIS